LLFTAGWGSWRKIIFLRYNKLKIIIFEIGWLKG